MLKPLKITVNGIEKEVAVRDADLLLDVLRDILGEKSVKAGCRNGDCGSCTILMDDLPYNACQLLAQEVEGKQITTIAGLPDTYIQKAFINHWAIQCGFCTPGFILNSYALAKQHPDAGEAEIAAWLDANICRCTGYQEIKQAVKDILAYERQQLRKGS